MDILTRKTPYYHFIYIFLYSRFKAVSLSFGRPASSGRPRRAGRLPLLHAGLQRRRPASRRGVVRKRFVIIIWPRVRLWLNFMEAHIHLEAVLYS